MPVLQEATTTSTTEPVAAGPVVVVRVLSADEEAQEGGLLPLPRRHREQQQQPLKKVGGLHLDELASPASPGVSSTGAPSPYGGPVSPLAGCDGACEQQEHQQHHDQQEDSPASTASLSSGSSDSSSSSNCTDGGSSSTRTGSSSGGSLFFPCTSTSTARPPQQQRQQREEGREESKGQSPLLSATAAAAPTSGSEAEAAAVVGPIPLTRSDSKMFLPHESSEFVSEEDAERIEEEMEDEDEEGCDSEGEEEAAAASASAAVATAGGVAGSPRPHHHHHHHPPRSEEERSAARAARKAAKAAARGGVAALLLQRAVSAPTPPPPAEDQVRVSALTLRELSTVDESPPQLLAPRLSLPSDPGRVAHCRASYGKAGRAKAFRGPAAQVRGPVMLYGEDVLAEAELLLPASVDNAGTGRPKWVRAMGVFDGHGLMGKEAARLAAERYVDGMRRTTMQTLGALLAGDVQRVVAVERERFRALDAYLEAELRSPTGGTTCSAVQVHAARGKAYAVVSNVGDSPVLLVENRTGRVALLTGRHSWDNPEERQRYLDRCQALGLKPRDVVYGRINCGGMRLEDADGGEEPFRMYLPGTAIVCTRTRDHLNKQVERRFRNSIGGSQSVRRFLWERRDEATGAWEVFRALEEQAHGNWGATVLVGREGKIQMSRSLGDSQEKQTAYIWSEPDVAVHEFGPGEDWTVVACSDGVADLWYFHELGELVASFFRRRDEERAAAAMPGGEGLEVEEDAQALAQLILDQTMDRGERTPGYGIGPRMSATAHLKRPMWDDMCIHTVRIVT